ncbi:MAG: copper homeostasis protein CutC [Flavipsychrobacter sp.]|nr:copper homeostasis protein CutC [Flavipsychrobacter sp.]
MSVLLEIAANSFQSCLSAQQGGADRIELFENLAEGGCTPSYGMLALVKEKINIPVYVMIRPRGGDFIYSNDEFEIMNRDIVMCKQLGFTGIVFGMLDIQGGIDVARCKDLLSTCGDMKATFHRAFDGSKDLHESMRKLIDLGFDRVLTSGGEPNVEKGKEAIKKLQQEYGKDIVIMPGCGVTSVNARAIVDYCSVNEIHATAKAKVSSTMQYSKLYFTDEWYESNTHEVEAIKRSLL